MNYDNVIPEYYRFLKEILSSCAIQDYQIISLLCSPTRKNGFAMKDLHKIRLTSDRVLIIIKDHIITNEYQNRLNNRQNKAFRYLQDFVSKHKNKKFILVTEHFNLDKHFNETNLDFIHLPKFLPFEYTAVEKLNNANSTSWMCICNCYKIWRSYLIYYILGLNLENYGQIFFDSSEYHFFVNRGTFSRYHNYILEKGYDKFLTSKNNYTLEFKGENIFENYCNALSPLYKNSYLELVPATLYSEPTNFITEKEIQNIFGKCFPIFISNAFTAETMEQLGFDVFRDVVDHSYDNIEDPDVRMFRAIDDNLHLLTGQTNLKKLWEENESRFDKNIEVYFSLEQKLFEQAEEKFEKILKTKWLKI